MKKYIAFGLLLAAARAWSEPVAGSLDVRWNEGAADCEATPQAPLQVHRYEPQTYILRQSLCADFEAPFIYLLIGSEKALLIDTGAVADPAQMPLAATVMELLPGEGDSKLPLLVVHSHGHGDHRAADAQFASLPSVQVVPAEVEQLREFFAFKQWPEGLAHIDLGGRRVDVLPAPGHHPAHLLFHDDRTSLLFTGDFLLPGRLLVDDIGAYRRSAARLAAYVKDRSISHVLGGHVELDAKGEQFPSGSQHHPNERPPALAKADVLALPGALADFNGFYSRHDHFVVTNPKRNLLAVVVGALMLIVAVVVAWRRMKRRRAV
jgi:hydroxyacylglutathione hydrolase